MNEPLTAEELEAYVAWVQDFDTLARESFMHSRIVATVRDLAQQLAEKDAALGALEAAAGELIMEIALEARMPSLSVREAKTRLQTTLAPSFVQQAVAQYSEARAVLSDIRTLMETLGNLKAWEGDSASVRVSIMNVARHIASRMALLGDTAQEER